MPKPQIRKPAGMKRPVPKPKVPAPKPVRKAR